MSMLNSEFSCKAVFFISERQWQKHNWSAIKIDLVKRHAYSLVTDLVKLNIDLEIVEVADFSAQIKYLHNYCQYNDISKVIANSEVEINEQQRDKTCIELGIPLKLFEADVIVPKGNILNKSGEMYKVFTPFKRAWLTYVRQYGFEYLGRTQVQQSDKVLGNSININDTEVISNSNSISNHWPLASTMEQEVLPLFIQEKLSLYSEQRDIPSIKGTSGLSPYLAIGAISPRYLLTLLLNHFPDLLLASDSPKFTW